MRSSVAAFPRALLKTEVTYGPRLESTHASGGLFSRSKRVACASTARFELHAGGEVPIMLSGGVQLMVQVHAKVAEIRDKTIDDRMNEE